MRSACGRPDLRWRPTRAPDVDAGTHRSVPVRVSLLRDSFSGINSRFHLVGLYTLVDVFLMIVLSMAGDDPALGGVVVTVLILAWGVTFGILGLVYHAAAGREGRPSFPRYALSLFLPLFWLQLKLGVLTYGPAILVAWGYYKVTSPADVALETWMGRTLFWAEPFAALVVQILALYSTPMCILLRERNESGTPIRQGLRLLRACPQETVRLVGLIFIITVLVGTVHYLH